MSGLRTLRRFSSRTGLAAGMFALGIMAAAGTGDAKVKENGKVTDLIERATLANDAFIRGDMRSWYKIAGPIAPDFTLMSPFGGAPSHGFDGSESNLDAMARRFTGGTATFELVQSYATADMVVLAFIERQHAQIGGLPEQDWSLRVTQVWARRNDTWELVHRHADPLAQGRTLVQTAAIASGQIQQ